MALAATWADGEKVWSDPDETIGGKLNAKPRSARRRRRRIYTCLELTRYPNIQIAKPPNSLLVAALIEFAL